MTGDRPTSRLFVAIDFSKTVRCGWCGRLESQDWDQFPLCTQECKRAAYTETNLKIAASFLGPSAILLLLSFVDFWLLFPGILSLIVAPWPILEWRRGISARVRRPKDSRINEGSVELHLLRRVSKHVQCPNCEQGSIDLTAVQEDMTYFCEYCNARGPIEIIQAGD
ncbi:MAG: hypothetical protein ACW98J_08490 [Candidatus Thorarchaeota archaeon]|jgi:hypothetical protein